MYCVYRLLAVTLLCLKGSYLVYGAKCAGQKFNPAESFCCGSTVHKIYDGGYEWKCCHGAKKPYSSTEQCCGSEVGENSQYLGCCRNKFYNTSTDRCCEGKLHINESLPCCGRRTFNPSTHLCCGSEQKLYDREANMACCGNRVYDQTITVCIGNDRVVKKGVGSCGNPDFKSSTENNKCCDGGMIDTRSLSSYLCCYKNQIFPPSTTHYCDGYKVLENHEQMCGKVKVIRKTQQCCGGSVFRVRTHVCCNNTDLVKKQHRKQNQCCGGTPMDANKDLCCDNSKLFKNAKKTKKCCNGYAIKASCKCCSKGRKKCCGKKTKRKLETLTCTPGQGWSRISDLGDAQNCLRQAFIVKKRKKVYRQQKKQQLLGPKPRTTVSWKLDKTCHFIKKKRFIIVETSVGVNHAIINNRTNRKKLKEMKERCNGS